MILIIQNDPRCPAGLYGKLLRAWRVSHGFWRPYAGEGSPPRRRLIGVIVLGGTMGVHDVAEYPSLLPVKDLLKEVVEVNLPCLGICLGGQLLAEALGAAVHSNRNGEKGCRTITLTDAGRKDSLFSGLSSTVPVFHWHNDSFEIPEEAEHLAFSSDCPGQAFRYGNAWGVQFHPEIDGPILEDWRKDAQTPEESNAFNQFCQQQVAVRKVGERLLNNFLATASAFRRRADQDFRCAMAR